MGVTSDSKSCTKWSNLTKKIISDSVSLNQNLINWPQCGYKGWTRRHLGIRAVWTSLSSITLGGARAQEKRNRVSEGGNTTNGLICPEYRFGLGRLYIPLDDMRFYFTAGGRACHLSEKQTNCKQSSVSLQTEPTSPTVLFVGKRSHVCAASPALVK